MPQMGLLKDILTYKETTNSWQYICSLKLMFQLTKRFMQMLKRTNVSQKFCITLNSQ